jgi:hypothetical protein
MESEFDDSKLLGQENLKHDEKEPSEYTKVGVFVNNIRLSSRHLKERIHAYK